MNSLPIYEMKTSADVRKRHYLIYNDNYKGNIVKGIRLSNYTDPKYDVLKL